MTTWQCADFSVSTLWARQPGTGKTSETYTRYSVPPERSSGFTSWSIPWRAISQIAVVTRGKVSINCGSTAQLV